MQQLFMERPSKDYPQSFIEVHCQIHDDCVHDCNQHKPGSITELRNIHSYNICILSTSEDLPLQPDNHNVLQPHVPMLFFQDLVVHTTTKPAFLHIYNSCTISYQIVADNC